MNISLFYVLLMDFRPGAISSTDFSKEAIVRPERGLRLRTKPDQSASSLLAMPYGSVVEIIDDDGPVELINGMEANWMRVRYKNSEGWVWGGYLSFSEVSQ